MVAENSTPTPTPRAQTQPIISDDDSSSVSPKLKSLCVPIESSPSTFVEIFSDELPSIPTSTVTSLLTDESAPSPLWTHAALLYTASGHTDAAAQLLGHACDLLLSEKDGGRGRSSSNVTDTQTVRLLASRGIAELARRRPVVGSTAGNDDDEEGDEADPTAAAAAERRSTADSYFTKATRLDQLDPMTWIGRGMLDLSTPGENLPRAKEFFGAALKDRGNILPALLGNASACYRAKDWKGSIKGYEDAIRYFPDKSGSGARVGLGMGCYKAGNIDRARACFKRAVEMERDNGNGASSVEGMVGSAVLDMASLDREYSKDYAERMERVVRLIAMANVAGSDDQGTPDGVEAEVRDNAMVKNHLGMHVFDRYTVVPGVTVAVAKGGKVVTVTGGGGVGVEQGDRVRIGGRWETDVVEEEDDDGDDVFRVRDVWKGDSQDGLKLYKKDYDKVQSLARTALSSTSVEPIRAESHLLLARVHHARDELEDAKKHYERAVRLSPDLTPARFGLAQTYIWDEEKEKARAQLEEVLQSCPGATDAHAALGLLEVSSSAAAGGGGGDKKKKKGVGLGSATEGLSHLRKAIDFDPGNPDLVLLEALALQQRESDYPTSLDKYRRAVKLMEGKREDVPWEILTNMGVLCHETKRYEEAGVNYEKALEALDVDGGKESGLEEEGEDGAKIWHDANRMFWNYVDTESTVTWVKGGDGLTWEAEGIATGKVRIGDHVRVDDNYFFSKIVSIEDGRVTLEDVYVLTKKYIDRDQSKEDGELGMDVDGNEDKDEDDEDPHRPRKLYVKRTNRRLANPSAVSVAFNFARLHEAAGRTVPAVELHKAILARHPSYVNSYLRLACIARDCGSLLDCSEWLKSACAVSPGNSEVLCLVGNLHLSLCDWEPAQSIFDQLLQQKVPNVEAYSMLCLGNIYFDNIKSSASKYTKHLEYAAKWYERILIKDSANAYAANGLGTVLAEKGELLRAKEIFNRVREVSGDIIPDALLNLGHIYLALSKHPEALQMYQSYMNRTKNNKSPITCKSQDEDDAAVLLYVAFAYFDWARQTELYNDVRAAPADERYRKCIEYIELAMKKSKKENVALRYNWCMANLQAANCVLRKLARGIRRTAKEVQNALDGLQASLPKVQTMIQWKKEKKKVPIPTLTLNMFEANCREYILNAKSHLLQDEKKEAEAKEQHELQRLENLVKQKEKEAEELRRKEAADRAQKDIDRRARQKQLKVDDLLKNWKKRKEQEKKHEVKPEAGDDFIDNGQVVDKPEAESDGESDNGIAVPTNKKPPTEQSLFDDSDDDDDDKSDDDQEGKQKDGEESASAAPAAETQKDLFGSSDEESDSDEELLHSSKRASKDGGSNDDQPSSKKRRVTEEEDED